MCVYIYMYDFISVCLHIYSMLIYIMYIFIITSTTFENEMSYQ